RVLHCLWIGRMGRLLGVLQGKEPALDPIVDDRDVRNGRRGISEHIQPNAFTLLGEGELYLVLAPWRVDVGEAIGYRHVARRHGRRCVLRTGTGGDGDERGGQQWDKHRAHALTCKAAAAAMPGKQRLPPYTKGRQPRAGPLIADRRKGLPAPEAACETRSNQTKTQNRECRGFGRRDRWRPGGGDLAVDGQAKRRARGARCPLLVNGRSGDVDLPDCPAGVSGPKIQSIRVKVKREVGPGNAWKRVGLD